MKDKKHIIIAIGASAGGLEALQEFILNIPASMVNISVIIAQHLSPTHKSMLVQLLSRDTKKSIVEAKHNTKIKPDVIYITPPDKDITVIEEKIHLSKPKSSLGPKPSVDLLFQSLATSSCTNVIGVILSGTGSDGAKGVQALKQAGAFIIAQEPKTAKYDGMPMSAIQTGVVDLVLSPDRMASEIMEYMLNPLDDSFSRNTQDYEDPLEAIIKLLSHRVGTDFGGYKIGTISRRLQKRLVHIGKTTYQEYLEYVKEKPEELDEMFKYALIGVTGFFRDYESFEVLHKELEKLLNKKSTNDTIRIWIPGCSTGEEAYSIAILINEILKGDLNKYNIRIFATDIDDEAINVAKKGFYLATQLENIPVEIKSKYFSSKGKLFEINKNLRNIILFSRHDITKNPPFLKLDLISCRNLLIYFGNELQKYLIPIFHYSLYPSGLLFLGKSETVGQFTQLFSTLDGKNKLFQRRPGEGVAPVRFQPTITRRYTDNYQQREKSKPATISERVKQTILKTYENPYVVIDKDFIIHEIKGDLRLFLSLKSGVIQLNLIKLVNNELQIELRSLITKAIKENIALISDIKRFNLFGREHYVRFKINPLEDNILDEYFLVIFENIDLKGVLLPKSENYDIEIIENQRVQELEYELNATKEHLQTYIEEIETSNEELQSLNEEMQSTNEELQSSNEELETTNEELQSTNEEIQVAYNELRQVHTILEKKEHLLNEKEQNQTALLSNTLQAFFLIDKEFTIQTFNSVADDLSKKLRSDFLKTGDSFIKLVSTNNMHLFATEVQKSFKGETVTGEVMEHNFKGEKIWLMFSLTPVINNHGAVEFVTIGILDITEKKIFSQKLTSTERLLHSIFDAAVTGICITDENGYFVDVNSEYCNIYGYESQELIGKHFTTVVPDHFKSFMSELHDRFIAGDEELDAEWSVQRKDGSMIDIFAKANLIKYDDGKKFKVTSVKDISDSKKYTNLLSGSEELSIVGGWEYDTISSRFEWTDETFEIFRVGKNFEISLYSMAKLFNDEAAAKLEESIQAAISNGMAFDLELEYNTAKDELLWIRLTCKPLRIHNQTIRLFGTAQNITHRKLQEIEILNSRQRYKSTFDNSLIGLLISHPDGTILDANTAIVEILGYSKSELCQLGRQPILDATSPMYESMFKEREQTGKTKGELYFLKKDGKRILCEVYSSVYISESGEKFASTLINDISEREMMQNQLKSITSNLPGVFYKYVMNPDGSNYFEYMSEGSMKMMGIPQQLIMKDSNLIWSKIHEDDLEGLILSVSESAKKLDNWAHEFRFRHPDGSIRWHRGSGSPFAEPDGRIIWNSIVLDVTLEKNAQLRLEEVNKKILALFEDVDGISVQGYLNDGTVKYWNKASELLYGYSKEEALGKKLWDLIIPDDIKEPVRKHVLKMIEDGKGTPSEELLLKHKEGYLVPVLSSHTVISISDEDTMLFCMDVDLTEINKTQAALIKSETNLKERTEMIELLLNSTAEAIYGIDEHGNCTFVNKACLSLLGYNEDKELLGKNIHEAIHHSAFDGSKHDLHSCVIYKASNNGESVYVEEDLFWKKDGSSFPVEYWSYPVKKNGNSVGGVVTFFDITEKKEQANKIKQTLKLLSDYKFALDQAANIVITDAKGIMLEVNESTCEISGYSRDELIGRHSKINKSGYHTEAFYVEMWNTIKNGNVWRGEIKNLKKNEEYYWIDTTIVPFLDKDGKPEKYLAIRFDITKEKNASKKVESNEKRFKALVQNSSDYVCILNKNGVYKYLSPSYEDVFGTFDLDISKIDPYEFVHTDDLKTIREDFQNIHTSKKVTTHPYRFKFKEKGWRWIESIATNYTDDPDIEGIVLNSRDITDKLIYAEIDNLERMSFKKFAEGKSMQLISEDILKKFEYLFPELDSCMLSIYENKVSVFASPKLCDSLHSTITNASSGNIRIPSLEAFKSGLNIIVKDVFADKDWASYHEIAKEYNLRASWNYPVKDTNGKVVVVVSFNSTSPGIPENNIQRVIHRIVDVFRILFENLKKDEAIKIVNQRFEFVNRATQDTVFDWDLYTNTVEWGHHFESFFGFTPEAIDSGPQEFLNLLHPGDKDSTNKAIQATLNNKTKNDFDIECRTIRPDGRIVYVRINAFILRDESGVALRMIGAFRNITETKQSLIRGEFISEMNYYFSIKEDYKDASKELIKSIINKLEVDYGEIWIKNEQRKVLKSIAKYSDNEKILNYFNENKLEFGINEGMPGRVWDQKKQLIWDDVQSRNEFIRKDEARKSGIEVVMGIPLLNQQEVQGVLLLMSTKNNNYSNVLQIVDDSFSNAFGAEIKRKQLENELAQIFNSSPDIISIAGFDGYFKKINPAASKLLGYSEEELLSNPYLTFLHPEDLEITMEEAKNINVNQPSLKFENRYITKTGDIKWLLWNSSVIYEEGLVYSVAKDITDRKNAEHKLLEKTAQLAAIAEINAKLIDYDDWLLSFDFAMKVIGETINADRSYIFKTIHHPFSGTKVIKMQHEWCADGIEPFINHEIISLLPFDQANEVLEQLLKGNTTSVLIDNLEDGEFKDLSRLQGIKSMLLVPIFENRSFWGFIGIDDCRDKRIWTESEISFLNTLSLNISAAIESQKSKTELILSNERFERVSQATNDAIWEFEIGRSQLLWNDGYWKIFGYEPPDSHDTLENWKSLIHPDDKERIIGSMYAHIEKNENAVWDGEYRFKRADGSWAYIYDRGSVIRDEHGAPLRMVGAMQDISSRKEFEESLKKLNLELQETIRELEMSNTDLEQFAFVASHDLQEPLRMITSFLTQLERKYEHVLDEKGKKYIYFATDGAKRMRQIILDLLDFSRVGRIDSDKTLTDMNQIVSDVLTMNHRLILEKGAIIESERLPIVTASKTLMTQVMQNIIVNAVKYQMSGNTPRVHVFCKDVVEHWQFSVSDNGIGINPEYKDKIFNIFQRLHGKDEYSGTGVGLAVSKKAVEYHQGKIWVEENPTGGSIFHFTIKKDTL